MFLSSEPSGLCDSIATIYREEGILGFFAWVNYRFVHVIFVWVESFDENEDITPCLNLRENVLSGFNSG